MIAKSDDPAQQAHLKSVLQPRWREFSDGVDSFLAIRLPGPDNDEAMIAFGRLITQAQRLSAELDERMREIEARAHNEAGEVFGAMTPVVLAAAGTALALSFLGKARQDCRARAPRVLRSNFPERRTRRAEEGASPFGRAGTPVRSRRSRVQKIDTNSHRLSVAPMMDWMDS